MGVVLVAAVAASLAASLSFAVSAVLEQRSARQVPDRGVFAPRLLVDLARRPLWVASIGATIIGLGLQVTALHLGPLALVQPILVCDLVFAVLLTAILRRAAPDRTLFAGVVCCAAGIAVFLAVAQPTGGTETVSLPAVIPLAAGLGAVLAGCLAWAKRGPRVARPIALALACGVWFLSPWNRGSASRCGSGRCMRWSSSGRSGSCSTRRPSSRVPCSRPCLP